MNQLLEEKGDFETRYDSFKQEFTVILDERERLKELNYRLNQEIESQTEELIETKREHIDMLQRMRLLLGPPATSMQGHNYAANSASEVVRDCEFLVDELRVRRDESHSYKAQIEQIHQTLDHERQMA